MKIVLKSYYKNSGLFKKGEFVKPIPSNSSQAEIENYLKEKMNHEGLKGNYSPSELEFIEQYLSETEEYKNSKKFKWKYLAYIFPIIGAIVIIYKLFALFFGWIVFIAVIALFYPMFTGQGLPRTNGIIAGGLIAAWMIWGGEKIIDTNRCLELSDLSGTWVTKDNVTNKKLRGDWAKAFSSTSFGDIELTLNKNGTFLWKEWSPYDGTLRISKEGSWEIICEEDKNYERGQVKSVDYENEVRLSNMEDFRNGFKLDEFSSNTLKHIFGGYEFDKK